MIILYNTIMEDYTFISDILDTNKIKGKFKDYIESLPNGCYLKWTEDNEEFFEEFDPIDYTDGMKLPVSLKHSDAKIEKIINVEFY